MIVATIHSWLIGSPIWCIVIFTLILGLILWFLEPILEPIRGTFWRFCAIPPQRLSVWILKARLSSAEMKLVWFHQICNDMRRFIYQCCLSLGSLVVVGVLLTMFSIVIAIAGDDMHTFADLHATPSVHMRALAQVVGDLVSGAMIIMVMCGFMIYASRSFKEVTSAVLNPLDGENKLKARVARLKEKLGLK